MSRKYSDSLEKFLEDLQKQVQPRDKEWSSRGHVIRVLTETISAFASDANLAQSLQAAEDLLSKRPDVALLQNKVERNMLEEALLMGRSDIAALTLKKCPEALEDRDEEGNTPLMRTILNGRRKEFSALLALGADMNAGPNANGDMPIHLAVQTHAATKGFFLETLLEKEARVDVQTPRKPNLASYALRIGFAVSPLTKSASAFSAACGIMRKGVCPDLSDPVLLSIENEKEHPIYKDFFAALDFAREQEAARKLAGEQEKVAKAAAEGTGAQARIGKKLTLKIKSGNR